jgi:hypothetical protein
MGLEASVKKNVDSSVAKEQYKAGLARIGDGIAQ